MNEAMISDQQSKTLQSCLTDCLESRSVNVTLEGGNDHGSSPFTQHIIET